MFLFFSTINGYAQTTGGIRFLPGSFAAAQAAAQKADKPLFVEVYLTGCPHCEALAPILTEKTVGDFYNANFVSWKIEANAPESKALQQTQNITYPEFPLLLFFDTDGSLMHVSTPAEQANTQDFISEVVAQGRIALNPAQRTASYKQRFEAGDRDLAFLINYGKYCKTSKDNNQLHAISDALGQALKQPDQLKSQVGFYCLQRIIDDIDNPAAVYFFSHLNEFTASRSAKDVKEAGEGIIFRALYGAKGDLYLAPKIVQMRTDMVALGVPAPEAASRTLLKELDAHLRANDTQAAVRRFNEYRREASTIGVADYAYLMHYFNEKAKDATYLPQMPVWAADGLKTVVPAQQASKQVADLYYELAVAYQKMGKKTDAQAAAQKGLATAQKAKIATKLYQEQITALK